MKSNKKPDLKRAPMYHIQPFPGLTYNRKIAGSLSKVVAPPYDVISPEEQESLYHKQHNIIRLILNKEEPDDDRKNNRYSRAAASLREWRKKKVLLKDKLPSLYFYVQNFSLPTGETFQREGFLGLLELSSFEEKKVLPHEYTLSKPRKDRTRLMLGCKSHLSPIFVLYPDPKNSIKNCLESVLQTEPFLNVLDKDRVRHRAWKISSPELIGTIQSFLKSKIFIIADGHHRYNASLSVKDQIRSRQKKPAPLGQPYDYTLSYFCNINSPGLTILPVHRMIHSVPRFSPSLLIEKLQSYFTVTEIQFRKNQIAAGIRTVQKEMKTESALTAGSFGLYFPGETRFMMLKGKKAAIRKALREKGVPEGILKLDVVTLHQLILEDILRISKNAQEKQKNIRYINGIENLPPILKRNDYQAFFLLNPVSFSVLKSVVKTGLCLPQKTTYFYPKLLSGIVLHSFE